MQFVIGSAYYEGKCVKKNDELALEWLLKASMGGEPKANALLSEPNRTSTRQASLHSPWRQVLRFARLSGLGVDASSQYVIFTLKVKSALTVGLG